MFDRLLVPTDFSASSETALRYGRIFARTFGASLHALHVLENDFLHAALGDPHDPEIAAMRQLQGILAHDNWRELRTLPVVERSDAPADAIASYARTHDMDLIVMGTHGRCGIAHMLVGSVAEKVVRTAPCPVLTLREGASGGSDARPARILVPTDFSPPSDAALDCARLLAKRFGASLRLVHVLEDPVNTGAVGSEAYLPEAPDIRHARVQNARERLAHRVVALDRSQPAATADVVFGASARTIVTYAAYNECDLIVMGTHGRTGVAHLLMGSVAEHVVRTATCPVLSVHEIRARAVSPVKYGRAIGAIA